MTKYLDVNVVISPGSGGDYTVRLESDAGIGNGTLKLPFTLAELSDAVFGVAETARGIGRVAADGQAAPSRTAADYGADMYAALFQGQVGERLAAIMDRAENLPDTGVRIRLSMDLRQTGMAEVASLPWELMCKRGERALVVSNRSAVVRVFDSPKPLNPQPFTAPLRILVIMSNPNGTTGLGLDDELARIKASWAKLPSVSVEFAPPVRQQILDKLREADFHVLHYMGHGDYAGDTGGCLVLETADSQPDFVTADDFAMMLADEPLRLVFLNACKTGTTATKSGAHPYAGVAAALVRERIPAVLAMQFPISDKAAIAFAETFYKCIAAASPVDYAVAEARKAIYSGAQPEWATPVLYMRSDTGDLFTPADVAPATTISTPAPMAQAAAPASAWGAASGDRLKLYLATPDQDWEKKHAALAAELGARDDCAVVAEVPLDDAHYGAGVDALLREADLCIHLLGANAGRRIDVDDGQPLRTYPLQQLEAGLKLAKSQIVLVTEADKANMGKAYADRIAEIEAMPRDKARFEFVVTDKNQMLAAIVAKLDELKRARAAAAAPASGAAGHRAYIDAHEKDAERAIDLFDYLATNKVDANINTSSSDTIDNLPALDEAVRSTGLYVIVAGEVDPAWVANRQVAIMRSAVKSRSKLVVAKYAAAANVTAPPISAARLAISTLRDGDRSWVDALFPADKPPE
jgi:hypothetical protein